ncbi:hypothetical protein LZ30DRAFT_132072 [Colletotrichum cereale]|nr:hypothetical protein LZ30DRAFT_132072 [Colletotrichum cereale]
MSGEPGGDRRDLIRHVCPMGETEMPNLAFQVETLEQTGRPNPARALPHRDAHLFYIVTIIGRLHAVHRSPTYLPSQTASHLHPAYSMHAHHGGKGARACLSLASLRTARCSIANCRRCHMSTRRRQAGRGRGVCQIRATGIKSPFASFEGVGSGS